MKTQQRHLGFIVILFLAVALLLTPGFTRPVQAASEDVAMFYDDLGQMGQWFEYESYGPVWHPSNVDEEWRPYTDGRWVPTSDGYVFESQEPWGWATYHYGNWMPTEGYGWCWVPGRTWYPSTVDWRTSPETASVDTSYVGWAPIPPPNYVPTQSYAPPGYAPGYGQGYGQGGGLLTEPFWIFARAASFLLGLGQPYSPQYSYGGCGCLAPPAYVPTFFPQTNIVPVYYTPAYYPATFFGGRVRGAYAWGPSTAYISRVSSINRTVINKTIINNTTNITNIRNIRPPQNVIARNPHIRDITPPSLVKGNRLPPSSRIKDIRTAQANLGRPNTVRAPQGIKPISANIPKVQPVAHQPGQAIRGAGLPSKATQKLTPAMEQQIKQRPQAVPGRPGPAQQAIPPAKGKPELKPGATPAVPGRPGPAQPAIPPAKGKPEVKPGATPAVPGRPGPAQPAVPPSPKQMQPGVTGRPGQVRPGEQPGRPAVQPQQQQQQQERQRQQQLQQRQQQERQQQQQKPQPQQLQQQRQQEQRQQQEGQRQQQLQQRQQQQQQQQERQRQQQLQQRQQQERQQQQRQPQPQQLQQQRQQEQRQQQDRQRQQQLQQRQQQQQQQQQRQPQTQQQRQPQPQQKPQVQPQPQQKQQPQQQQKQQPQPQQQKKKPPDQPQN